MRTTRLSRVKVRLDDEADAAAHDTLAVAPAHGRLHAAHALIGHALEEAHIKVQLVPLNLRALDLHKGQGHRSLPVVDRLQDEVVERVADFGVGAIKGIREVEGLGVVFAATAQTHQCSRSVPWQNIWYGGSISTKLLVIPELLGHGGLSEEEAEVLQHRLLGRGKGSRLNRTVNGSHVFSSLLFHFSFVGMALPLAQVAVRDWHGGKDHNFRLPQSSISSGVPVPSKAPRS